MKKPEERSVDPASIEMLALVADKNQQVAWDRYEAQQPQCGFGLLGLCCRNCTMGPCRIDPFGDGPSEGICGATADVIASPPFADYVRTVENSAGVGGPGWREEGVRQKRRFVLLRPEY